MDKSKEELGYETEAEKSLLVEADETVVPPIDVVAFTELRSAADLYRMYEAGDLEIHPEFQREEVWTVAEQTRFIDSLVKQLPIPSLCFGLDYRRQQWQVIDGLQRIATIIKFLDPDSAWRLSRLDDINRDIAGVEVGDLRTNDQGRKIVRVVENITLPITVIRCDYSKSDHRQYLFQIFHRLNSGGKTLRNQEIRNCIYCGGLNDMLNALNSDPVWLRVSGLKSATGKRFKGQELILRFFAFYDSYEEYSGKLATFLNNYMDKNQYPDEDYISHKRELFHKTMSYIDKSIGSSAASTSQTLFEAVMVGVARNIDMLQKDDSYTLGKIGLEKMKSSTEFQPQFLREGLGKREKLIGRMDVAVRSMEHARG